MFCGKCGTQNPDTAAFCKVCGNRLNDQTKTDTQVTHQASVGTQTRTKSFASQNKNRWMMDTNKIIGIVAVALVLVLAVGLLGGRSYKAPVRQFFNATFDANAQKIWKLIPDDFIDYHLKEEGLTKKDFKEQVAEMQEDLEEEISYLKMYLGDKWKVSYKIAEVESIKGDELKALKQDYKKYGVRISAAKDVELDLTIKAGELERSTTVTISLIKVGGSWYLDPDSMGSLL